VGGAGGGIRSLQRTAQRPVSRCAVLRGRLSVPWRVSRRTSEKRQRAVGSRRGNRAEVGGTLSVLVLGQRQRRCWRKAWARGLQQRTLKNKASGELRCRKRSSGGAQGPIRRPSEGPRRPKRRRVDAQGGASTKKRAVGRFSAYRSGRARSHETPPCRNPKDMKWDQRQDSE